MKEARPHSSQLARGLSPSLRGFYFQSFDRRFSIRRPQSHAYQDHKTKAVQGCPRRRTSWYCLCSSLWSDLAHDQRKLNGKQTLQFQRVKLQSWCLWSPQRCSACKFWSQIHDFYKNRSQEEILSFQYRGLNPSGTKRRIQFHLDLYDALKL